MEKVCDVTPFVVLFLLRGVVLGVLGEGGGAGQPRTPAARRGTKMLTQGSTRICRGRGLTCGIGESGEDACEWRWVWDPCVKGDPTRLSGNARRVEVLSFLSFLVLPTGGSGRCMDGIRELEEKEEPPARELEARRPASELATLWEQYLDHWRLST